MNRRIAPKIEPMIREARAMPGLLPGFCRDCYRAATDAPRCRACGSPRLLRHGEIDRLTIAHVDCDAFYATIEKRDNPSLNDVPLIVGGGRRGVVTTACYIARTFGVRSAMPMFKARALCPDAVIISPNMAKYAQVGRQVREMMRALTPLVEPLSIDEAFLDLAGTERLHECWPAISLAKFAARVEHEIGISVSVGLAPNKFLAKIASDLNKPRGFAVLGQAEARAFLAPRPLTFIYGIGAASEKHFAKDGLRNISDVQARDEIDLMRRYGPEGRRLWRLSHGLDDRPVVAERETKSVSAETTFNENTGDYRALERILWELCERVSARLKKHALAGSTITLKLKTADFRIRTRARSLGDPTQLAVRIFEASQNLLRREADGTRFRLLGVGASNLAGAAGADPIDWIDHRARASAAAETALDRVRNRFGDGAIVKGLAFEGD